MHIHTDLNQRAAVHAAQIPWLASPIAGVERRMLHRLGDEVAQATSIVRYAPGSQFSAHTHTGGEEFLVLEGVFQDEHGDYPAGSYIRNPPQSRHTPGSAPGTTIFVKLWQFDLQDRTHVRVPGDQLARIEDARRPGVQVSPLFKDANEDVRMELWPANSRVELDLPEGGEFLLLEGGFSEGGERFAPQSWLRLPRASRLQAQVGAQGAKVWAKLGHLGFQAGLKLPGSSSVGARP
jgi:quercetin dioxygenase-like cupin family protein